MNIKDIELTRYRSFASYTLSQKKTELWSGFAKILELSATFLSVGETKGLDNTVEKEIKKKPHKKGKFVRILKSGTPEDSYIKFSDFERRILAGTFLDCYLLNESVYKKNEPQSLKDIAQELVGKLPVHPQLPAKLPADCFCYFVESAQPDLDKDEIFAQLLSKKYKETDLDHSYFAISLEDKQAVAVIIPKGVAKTTAHSSATQLFGEVIQEYFLAFAKVANESAAIGILKSVETRTILTDFLDWLEKHPPKTLSEIEYANRELAKYRADLAANIVDAESHIHTIEINIRNAEDVLNYNILKEKKKELAEILIKPLQHQLEQIKANLDYLKLYDNKAKINVEEITNLSNLQAGIYGRKLAWFFGLLTLIGTLQLFKNFTDWISLEQLNWGGWEVTLIKILILAVIILLPCLVIFRIDIKEFLSSSNYEFEPERQDNIETDETEIETENKSIIENKPQDKMPPAPAQTETPAIKKVARKQKQ